MPVLAAAKKPPVNTVAGIAYSQLYSGGSVGPIRTSVHTILAFPTHHSRLNISNILFVITNPPATFTLANSTDSAPSACGTVPGK